MEYAVEIVVKRRGIKNLMQANKSLRYSHNVLDKKAEVTSLVRYKINDRMKYRSQIELTVRDMM